jgi:hypothetical protein
MPNIIQNYECMGLDPLVAPLYRAWGIDNSQNQQTYPRVYAVAKVTRLLRNCGIPSVQIDEASTQALYLRPEFRRDTI